MFIFKFRISQFNEKVETFEKFFFTYTQRVNDIDEKGKNNEHAFTRLFDTVIKNKESS
jgi:transcription termination factor NusB